MVSDAAKKRDAQKKAAAAARRGGKGAATSKAAAAKGAAAESNWVDSLANGIGDLKISDRTCTGVLCSHPLSRDIRVGFRVVDVFFCVFVFLDSLLSMHLLFDWLDLWLQLVFILLGIVMVIFHGFVAASIESLSVTFHGHDLIVDSELELNYGRRYGLLGLNGCGKSTLLTAIGLRELPIPEHMDIFHLSREIEASDMTSLEAVINCDEERLQLEKEAEALAGRDDGGGEQLERIYERLEAMDAATAEKRAAEILFGLGFDKKMQAKKTRDFSGGWRMRIALARALFMNPTILLLDEPTNHLDLEACVWLEESLKNFERILVVISHSQDFLNGVCTNIIHMQNKKLKIYTGNYDQYVQTRSELEENQMKQYKWEQDQIAAMKEYIARFGHGSAKLARQAQSKEKTLAKMERGGLTEKVGRDSVLVFRFTDVGKLPPPVLQFSEVSFGYTPDNLIYKNLDFGVDLDSRIALVGPNGAGKSTLLKLMIGDLFPTDGMVKRHNHLKIAQYHQHLAEKLDMDMSALQYMMREYPGNEEEKMRAAIGRFGLTGKAQVMAMKNLSDGQRSRVIFAWLAYRVPHMLLLDEPTNHLDIETIDSLAEALNAWDGGMVLVSHDFRLINQVAHEIWVCENQAVTRWEGDIMDFKKHLKKRAGLGE
ncbi:ATP-binding cassette sub-family F member 2 [Capsicum annuum]|nr:ATP-binding cassette sub-family F member 2 [Capsicum annuum]